MGKEFIIAAIFDLAMMGVFAFIISKVILKSAEKEIDDLRREFFLTENRILQEINRGEIRLISHINTGFNRVSEREQELREKTLMLEFKNSEEVVRKRGRPPKN